MPIHDWTRVPSGMFHHFHQDWSVEIARALNRGRLPKEYSALVERRTNSPIVRRTSNKAYADRANRVVVKHRMGPIVSVIEIVSPGNEDTRSALIEFVKESIELLRDGIQLLIVDLNPPSVMSCGFNEVPTAYVEPVGVGDRLPDMPLYISSGHYVMVPLEPTYQVAWDSSPEFFREIVASGGEADSERE